MILYKKFPLNELHAQIEMGLYSGDYNASDVVRVFKNLVQDLVIEDIQSLDELSEILKQISAKRRKEAA